MDDKRAGMKLVPCAEYTVTDAHIMRSCSWQSDELFVILYREMFWKIKWDFWNCKVIFQIQPDATETRKPPPRHLILQLPQTERLAARETS